ncbi:alpha-N-acetylgalactosaminidase-like [Sycon ciliatum]|uniref:alpha-N-acetylgalactosaminidase-like n=1 Tax=Sycon ciliatum TaxID=27933 RepID=UPI0020AA3337|eukprot:scpid75879/ scgid29657/ Alpha-N-acetylgalactosaminidase; Alpha-galactosidase B
MVKVYAVLCLLGLSIAVSNALNNGLVRTPPMGWLAWERYRCNIDCEKEPDNCINEDLFLRMANLLNDNGYAAAGYDRVNIDDCWPLHNRDEHGRLVADPVRFPHGIKYLADKLHKMNMKLGIYGDYGTKTCGGYPGMMGYIRKDSETFASWGIDMLKLDGCYADVKLMNEGYAEVTRALNQTGREIVYSCSWPDYQRIAGMNVSYENVAKHCNLWRNYIDIQDSWDSVTSIIDFYGEPKNYRDFGVVNGPGQWNDPDMLILGDYSLSKDQSIAQFVFWCYFSAPLFMSNDLAKIQDWTKEILLNADLIAINQDPLGRMAQRVSASGGREIWRKELADGSVGVILWNRSTYGTPVLMTVTFAEVGLSAGRTYCIRDLVTHVNSHATTSFSTYVNPAGGVIALKVSQAC